MDAPAAAVVAAALHAAALLHAVAAAAAAPVPVASFCSSADTVLGRLLRRTRSPLLTHA